MSPITLVIMTRDRGEELASTLAALQQLPEQPPIVVVDNGSPDQEVAEVARRFPSVTVMALGHNAGVAARNLAVESVDTPYVAFNDDDSVWTPGSLHRIVEAFDAHPRVGALTAHILVGADGRDDPTSVEMADSPVSGDPELPGTPVLGFLACATAVRREAYLDVGGFEQRFHFGGEEELLATDLAAAGWGVRYLSDAIVRHTPSTSRNQRQRQRRGVRNTLWYLWLRRPARSAARRSWRVLRDADTVTAVGGLAQAAAGAGWVARNRRVVPGHVEEGLCRLEPQQARSEARQYAR